MKRVVIEFFGGCWDGHTLDSESPDQEERKLAHSYFFRTGDGTIGQGFAELSPQARQYAEKHKWELPETVGRDTGEQYQVVEKLDEAERLVVKLRHHTRV